eukprot:6212979-Pleurochrysis_carterae.AAC.2
MHGRAPPTPILANPRPSRTAIPIGPKKSEHSYRTAFSVARGRKDFSRRRSVIAHCTVGVERTKRRYD